jgi:hypothetical protein
VQFVDARALINDEKQKNIPTYLPTHLLIVWVGNAKQTIF